MANLIIAFVALFSAVYLFLLGSVAQSP